MVQIDEAAARALMRFGEDVLDIDSRSRCSDKYFRQHFTMIAKNPYVCDAFLALKRGLDAVDGIGALNAARESAPKAAEAAAPEASGQADEQEPPSGGDEEPPSGRRRKAPET